MIPYLLSILNLYIIKFIILIQDDLKWIIGFNKGLIGIQYKFNWDRIDFLGFNKGLNEVLIKIR